MAPADGLILVLVLILGLIQTKWSDSANHDYNPTVQLMFSHYFLTTLFCFLSR